MYTALRRSSTNASDTTATCCRCSRPSPRRPAGRPPATAAARAAWPAAVGGGVHVGREASPHNFQLTLALVQCHAALGSVHEATRLYHALGVKHIQQDSLSHLILPPLLRCGALEQAATVLNPAQRFAKDGLRDMPDSLQLAFSSDNYVEALEFVQFEGHLEASWWRRLVVVAAIVHQLPLRLRTARRSRPPADALQTADSTTALDGDVSAVAAALPDTDTTVHESHLPSENGKAVACDAWLARRAPPPRRALGLGGDDDALAAAEAALRACGAGGGGGGGAGRRRRRRRGTARRRRTGRACSRSCASPSLRPAAETAAPAAVAAEADALGTLLAGECARLRGFGVDGGPRRRSWRSRRRFCSRCCCAR